MKKIIISLAVMGTMLCSNLEASAAQTIGFVDMSKILSSYSKAQSITTSVNNQQNEIQKMLTDARSQVNNAKTDTEKAELEKKLTEEIQQKNNVFKAEYEKNVQSLQDNIVNSVKKVAENKKIDCIFRKDNVIIGGKDITEDVLAELNK
ncbi:MAG: hypothetical protein A2039_00405 [Candidatus Melainabacteria bacterium GWA2_34_9]|nr:MAG: hypothetical protein A2039_00405 [Candidatus Melainabacteria bacterium GWA2_34_9]